ncbi:MAG TPA: ABC transporter ATP-binding protein [Humibacillus sp.]|nr:ABC transporter ATP-binding protein [Humibacillus sp.]
MGRSVIETDRLTKAFGDTVALRDLTLEVAPGEVFGYLGPNGAGKTTTLRLIMGLIRPTSGSATVLGLDAWRDAVQIHARVGYVPGELALYDRLTGYDHVDYLAALRGTRRPSRADQLADQLDLDLQRPARELSRGNRQKVALVLALMSEPELLVLDEPTGGLDPMVQRTVQALILDHAGAGGAVLLSSHVLGEVQRVASRIGVLRSGRLVAVERLDDLRSKSLHHVEVQFAAAAPTTILDGVPDLRDIRVEGPTLQCSAPQSSLDALLKVVSTQPVVDFACAEAELEETFLAYYGTGDTDAA